VANPAEPVRLGWAIVASVYEENQAISYKKPLLLSVTVAAVAISPEVVNTYDLIFSQVKTKTN
jgi:hypothetical protein